MLRRERLHPAAQDRLAGYLSDTGVRTTRFDSALCDALLHGRSADAEAVHDDLLGDFDHFTTERKRLLLDACLAVVGAIPFDEGMRPDKIHPNSRVRWVNLIGLSLRVLIASGLARPDLADAAECDQLVRLLDTGPDGVWENHMTANVLGLLAISTSTPGHRVVAEGAEQLVARQNRDGGMPAIADLAVFASGPAGLALARAGAEPDLLQRMGDYLERQQLPDGGWPFGEGTSQSDVDTTSYATAFLAVADPVRHRSCLDRAGRYLAGMAGLDGGLPTYVAGDPPEVGMTAGATCALGFLPQRHADLLGRSANFLLKAQRPDGTFERSWSLSESNTIWRTMWALRSLPHPQASNLDHEIQRARNRSLGFLRSAQNDDGGWGYRPGDPSDTASTAYSLLALSAIDEQAEVIRRGITHLLRRQESDGGYTALPDQVAPRPLLFDAPVFADIWALLALTGNGRPFQDRL
ncbi:prenyltransferase/squalene oxidase repeat-containing protein [Spirillospora sp. NPDC048911]|uniref:prenyltransferase/squalene oxidase repeat-containing protein n=1 Tax=Spirillospora sp. NPDC048911 TaxID=3364527 RepID=UPI003718C7A6